MNVLGLGSCPTDRRNSLTFVWTHPEREGIFVDVEPEKNTWLRIKIEKFGGWRGQLDVL